MSRLVALVDANGHATRYEHTDCGLVSKTTWPDASFESYTYDGAGRLATRTDRRQIVSTFSYFDDGRLQSLTFSDGSPALSYTYDDDLSLTAKVEAIAPNRATRFSFAGANGDKVWGIKIKPCSYIGLSGV